jgi:uncharacterized protein (TIGR02246 family)
MIGASLSHCQIVEKLGAGRIGIPSLATIPPSHIRSGPLGGKAMKTIGGAALVLLLVLTSACAQKVNDPADVQAIKDTQPAFDKAWNAGNAEAVTSGFYTADATRMDPNQPALTGKDAIRASLQKYFDQFTEEGRNVAEDVRVSGDLAVARGTFEGKSSLKAGGYSAQAKGKWVTAFQRQADGSWKSFWDIYNSDLAVADALPLGQEELALLQIERDWAAANPKNDAAVVERLLANEFVHNFEGRTQNKKQLLAEIKANPAKIESAANSQMKAMVFGDTAVVHGLYAEKSTINRKDTSGQFRWTDVFVKRDGRWQCVTSYVSKATGPGL